MCQGWGVAISRRRSLPPGGKGYQEVTCGPECWSCSSPQVHSTSTPARTECSPNPRPCPWREAGCSSRKTCHRPLALGKTKIEPCLLEHEHSRLTLKEILPERKPSTEPSRGCRPGPSTPRCSVSSGSKTSSFNLVCNNSLDQGGEFFFHTLMK